MSMLNIKPIPEYIKQKALVLIWPDTPMVWGKKIIDVQADYSKLIDIILEYEDVFLVVKKGQENTVKSKVNPKTQLIGANYNRIWIRDSAPVWGFDKDNMIVGIDFLYEDYYKERQISYDNQLGRVLCETFNIKRIESHFEMEGGNYTTNGSMIFSNLGASSFQGKNSTDIAMSIKSFFNAEISLLDVDITGDRTAHIDNILHFADENKVLIYDSDETKIELNHNNYETYKIFHPNELYRLHDDLISIKDYPKVNPKFLKRVAYSYLNIVELNNAVLIPQYGLKEADAVAYEVFHRVYKNKKIVPFNVKNIILGGGGLHCITKEIPLLSQSYRI